MTQSRWTFEQIAAFAHHPDYVVRQWVIDRLARQYSAQAADVIADLLADPADYLVMDAANFVGDTGDAARYGPIVLDHLQRPAAAAFEFYAEAAGRLVLPSAVPILIDSLSRAAINADPGDFTRVVEALGRIGGDQARAALWARLDHTAADDFTLMVIAPALLDAALPDDVDRLVRWYRAQPVKLHQRFLPAFAHTVGVARFYAELLSAARFGFDEVLDLTEDWLNVDLPFNDDVFDNLEESFESPSPAAFQRLARAVRQLLIDRGDDWEAWHQTWQTGVRPMGYQRQAVLTLRILEAFAAQSDIWLAQARAEFVLGMALLFQLSADHDDQTWLARADNPDDLLLTILLESREHVLPDVVEHVVALGPSVIPRLIELLAQSDEGWGQIRLVRVIEQLARRFPGQCDAAIPILIDLVDDDQGDYLLEAICDALVAIGPAATEPLIAAMRDDDISRQIYLTGALAEIPSDRAAQAILDLIDELGYAEEYHIGALQDIGSPLAIEPLLAMWEPDNAIVAEALLVLCEINGVKHPSLPRWRHLVNAVYNELNSTPYTWQRWAEYRGLIPTPPQRPAKPKGPRKPAPKKQPASQKGKPPKKKKPKN